MKRLLAAALLLLSRPALAGPNRIAGSKHDFSVTSPGAFRATAETNACRFCHGMHAAYGKNLDNRPGTQARHTPYESSTMVAPRQTPTSASRICLSCHDGTVAVGRTRRGSIAMAGGDSQIPRGHRANLGTDLRGTHPVSMPLLASATLRPPPAGDAVKLDATQAVQCTSCHDPHDEWRDPDVGKFLVKPSKGSALCVTCHAPGGESAAVATHLTGTLPTVRTAAAGAPTAASPGVPDPNAGCATCHDSHGADTRGRLLKVSRKGDDLCLGCHGGDGTIPITPELAKPSSHAADTRLRHDAGEKPDAPEARRLPEDSVGSPRHSSCMDCHDPHTSNTSPAVAPRGSGALAGVWGIDLQGKRVAPAQREYEVCFKCHGDSANKPQDAVKTGPRRRNADTNLRLVFSPSAVSSHPVAAPGRTAVVPSLKAPLTTASMILCTDCHNSDSGPAAGGGGPRGPHGSRYPSLLERQYLTADYTQETSEAYALCYKCHDRQKLLSDQSTFPSHAAHVLGKKNGKPTPCSACHAAHGVSSVAAFNGRGAHLISFDLSIVQQNQSGMLSYETSSTGHGSCTLSCHGEEHGPGASHWTY
jgi:predicted CXXCH cytochrome family protein